MKVRENSAIILRNLKGSEFLKSNKADALVHVLLGDKEFKTKVRVKRN